MAKKLGQFMCSKCKVASLLSFAHFGMKIHGGAQLLSCSRVMDHTIIMLFFHTILIGQRSFGEIKHVIFLCIPSFNYYNLDIQRITIVPIPCWLFIYMK